MARPNRSAERRRELIRTVADTFAELGYRRTTTAVLAERCGLTEAALYRLWRDKRAMFVAAIEFVGTFSEQVWRELAERDGGAGSGAERVLSHEAKHLGDLGLYRILFAAFSETDDPAIAAAMRGVYRRLLDLIAEQVALHRSARSAPRRAGDGGLPPPEWTAWALIGLGTASNLGRELGLLGTQKRRQMFAAIGGHLLG